jgi:hypothetical protein
VTSTTADYGPLVRPAAKTEVAEYRRRVRAAANGRGGLGVAAIVAIVLGSLVGGFILLVMLLLAAGFAASAAADGGSPWLALPPLVMIALITVGIVLLVRRGNHGRWERRLRLSRFAEANGLVYSPGDPSPGYAGSIFGLGGSRQVSDHMRSASGRFIDYGNYHYMTSNGKNQQRHDWGFLAMRLDRPLPHMVLDAKANDGIFASSLPATFSRNQRLSLEGDFDRYFTLYCPREYERDALYVFTPDLMALLIDEAAAFDVEIVDDWLFVYTPRALAMTDPAVHERMFRIVSTVGAKTVTQTDRYVDARAQVAPPAGAAGPGAAGTASVPAAALPVATPGRRLRTGLPVAVVVALVAAAAVCVLTITVVFALLLR